MSDVKWIKICTDIFDDEKIALIESMPEADGIIVIWFKLLCAAGKQNNGGVFMLNDKIPYTDEMLATIFRRPLNTVRLALETFKRYGMIEIYNDIITIPNWEKHQNLEKLELSREKNRQRVAKCRKKQKQLAECNDYSNVTVMKCNADREEEEKEEDKEFHSFNPSEKMEFMGGKLGKGVVLLSEEQEDDLLNRLSLDEFNKYVGIIADCELNGKKFKKKSHYQAILDMVEKDRKVKKE